MKVRRGARVDEESNRETEERRNRRGDAVGILPPSFSHWLPVVTAPISCPRGTPHSSARTSHNSPLLCVTVFISPPGVLNTFLFWVGEYLWYFSLNSCVKIDYSLFLCKEVLKDLR